MNSGNDLRDTHEGGDSPHFQMDLLSGQASGDPGDSPRVRISARARRLSLRVYPDARVEVVVPRRARPGDIERFVAAHREWIDEKRAHALRNRPAPQPFPPAVIDLRMCGERFRLQMAGGAGRLRLREVRSAGPEQILQVLGNPEPRGLRKALRAWLMTAARERLEPRVAALAASTGVRYSKVSIRRQRSRWGSCSMRGTISLNCCLLFQRREVVNYLVIHELTHVTHMNHSARFWQAVEKCCAEWRELDRELVQGWRHVPRWVFSDEG
jgi:predicted metal-dependent hydrolase